MVLQAAFFRLADIIPMEEATAYMKKAAEKSFAKKGEQVVKMNLAAIDQGVANVVELVLPESWKDAVDAPKAEEKAE